MIKTFLSMLLLLTTANNLFAQQDKPVKTGDEWRMPTSAIIRSRHFADTLTQTFKLDAATNQKLYDVYLANTKPVDEIPMLPISDDEKKNRLKANKAAFDESIKGILTTAQFATYLKMDLGGKKHR